MTKHLLSLLALLTFSACAASTPIVAANTTAGKTKGELRAEWVPLYKRGHLAEGTPSPSGELKVYWTKNRSLIQEIPLDVPLEGLEHFSIEFTDLNDDGFQDLVFYDSNTGTAGASLAADVFLWIPARGLFVQSKTLSQAGELAKSKKKGCVEVTSKCSSFSYNTITYCFNKNMGRWRILANNRCVAPGP